MLLPALLRIAIGLRIGLPCFQCRQASLVCWFCAVTFGVQFKFFALFGSLWSFTESLINPFPWRTGTVEEKLARANAINQISQQFAEQVEIDSGGASS